MSWWWWGGGDGDLGWDGDICFRSIRGRSLFCSWDRQETLIGCFHTRQGCNDHLHRSHAAHRWNFECAVSMTTLMAVRPASLGLTCSFNGASPSNGC